MKTGEACQNYWLRSFAQRLKTCRLSTCGAVCQKDQVLDVVLRVVGGCDDVQLGDPAVHRQIWQVAHDPRQGAVRVS